MDTESFMGNEQFSDSFERFWQWAKEHPFAVTTAAMLLVAVLALPLAYQGAHPAPDVGPDETPLFV